MKVKELVEKLLQQDQEAEVITQSGNFELHGALVSVDSIIVLNEAKQTEKTFYDAFDHESYSKTVWLVSGGSQNAIWI